MAAITVTAAQVAPVKEEWECDTFVAATAIAPGQFCYINTGGSADLALAETSGGSTSVVKGMAMASAAAGQAVTLLKRGVVAGFTLGTALAYGAPLYLSSGTAGQVVDAQPGNGTAKVPLGRVTTLSDYQKTRLFEIDIQTTQIYGTAAL